MRSCSSWFATYSALPEVAESVGGQYFYMVVGLKPGQYHGPGTYAIPFTAFSRRSISGRTSLA